MGGQSLIDLHCHLLPGIDDGPATLAESLDLARMSAAQGIATIACTPHILPGVFDNDGAGIAAATALMQAALDQAGIPIRLVTGADLHIAPDNVSRLRSGQVPPLAGSRYVLLELPHALLPPRLEHALFAMRAAGFVPVLTHPERMGWIERDYGLLRALARAGVPMQITAGSVTGAFGRRARHWSDRMLDDGIVDLVATDAHGATLRPPCLAEAYGVVAGRIGADEARRIFFDVPEAILADRALPDSACAAEAPPLLGDAAGLLGWARGLLARSRDGRRSGHA